MNANEVIVIFGFDGDCSEKKRFPIMSDDPETQEVFYLLMQLMRQHVRGIDALTQQNDVHYQGQGRCVVFLEHFPGLGQRELATKLHIEPATLSPMLKRMEKSGLVERVRDEGDNRILRVWLTEKGRRAAERQEALVRTYTNEVFKIFKPEETAEFKRLLTLLHTGLERALEVCASIDDQV